MATEDGSGWLLEFDIFVQNFDKPYYSVALLVSASVVSLGFPAFWPISIIRPL